MTLIVDSAQALQDAVGRELGPSPWLLMTQARVNGFADATEDHQWIHVDRERAATGPFGACIAHGYLSLSLVSHFLPQLLSWPSARMGLNYGCDRVRFPAPVRVGERLRASGRLMEVAQKDDGGHQLRLHVEIRAEHAAKPACVAEVLVRVYLEPEAIAGSPR